MFKKENNLVDPNRDCDLKKINKDSKSKYIIVYNNKAFNANELTTDELNLMLNDFTAKVELYILNN